MLTGICVMIRINNYNDLKNEKVAVEIRELLNEVNKVQEEIGVYCDLMKQMFLSGSSKN